MSGDGKQRQFLEILRRWVLQEMVDHLERQRGDWRFHLGAGEDEAVTAETGNTRGMCVQAMVGMMS